MAFMFNGDIPAIEKDLHPDKSAQEKTDLLYLAHTLDKSHRARILALWQEYEDTITPEAKVVKALDKLETILQHNQRQNPPDFDYKFNLSYGQKHTSVAPLFALIRSILDECTCERISQSNTNTPTEHCLQCTCDHPSQKVIEVFTSSHQNKSNILLFVLSKLT